MYVYPYYIYSQLQASPILSPQILVKPELSKWDTLWDGMAPGLELGTLLGLGLGALASGGVKLDQESDPGSEQSALHRLFVCLLVYLFMFV